MCSSDLSILTTIMDMQVMVHGYDFSNMLIIYWKAYKACLLYTSEEALANALAHANYYGRRGILVVKKGKELSISNPGTIRRCV